VKAVAETESWLRENPPKIEWLIDADCGETPADDPFVELMAVSTQTVKDDVEIEGISFHTDMGWFTNYDIPTVNFGPGLPRGAHQNNESVSEDDLIDTTKGIALTILNWCNQK
jgi:acetylornithine deacetylase